MIKNDTPLAGDLEGDGGQKELLLMKSKDFCKTSVDLEFGVAGVTGMGKERVKRPKTSRFGHSETVGSDVLGESESLAGEG